jgi:glucose/arabinose dehydrogenase
VRIRSTVVLLSTAALIAGCGAEDEVTDPPPTSAPDADDAGGDPDDGPVDPDADTDDGTSGADDDDPEDDGDTADDGEVEVTTRDVVTGLEAPWDVAFLDDRTFVTERDRGRVVELVDGEVAEVRSFAVDSAGEGGLLGLVAGPDDLLYAYLTTTADNRVVRFDPDTDDDPEEVLTGIPRATTHNGGRVVFGPDDLLYLGTGDAQDLSAPRDETSLAGKVLRVTPDGAIPDDNPFGNEVWSLGHRNVQGLAFDADGQLWASEFGPDVDDEVNLIEPGADYGWPEVTGAPGEDGFVDAALVRQPDVASWTGASVLRDGAVPQWEGDLFVAALRGERLWRVPVEGSTLGDPEELLVGDAGRLRHAVQAPDGSLWLLTNNRDGRGSPAEDDDRIIRLGPAD